MWLRGYLRAWTRPHGQRRLYDAAVDHLTRFKGVVEPLLLLCHRRLGKTFFLSLLGLERCLRQPGAQVKFGSATKSQAIGLLRPQLDILLRDMPGDINFRTKNDTYFFNNPDWNAPDLWSVLEPVGLDYRTGDMLRGAASDLILLDEVRDVTSLEYAVESVLVPQFVGRPHPLLVMATTPPRSLDHAFVQKYVMANRANEKGTLITIPASQNADWTEEDERIVAGDCGDKSSATYRREIECELISDLSGLVVPEFAHVESDILVHDRPQDWPAQLVPYVVFDEGFRDHTGVLFAYLDFERQVVRIVDEIFINRTATDDLVKAIRVKLHEHFYRRTGPGEAEVAYPYYIKPRLHADAKPGQLEDIRRRHGLHFHAVRKYDRDAALAQARTFLQSGKIEIARRCEKFIYQLKNGIWNKSGRDFERSTSMGHLDLIAAYVYLTRVVDWRQNPFPRDAKTGWDIQWREGRPPPKSTSAEAFRTLLGHKKR